MLVYSTMAALYLGWLALGGEFRGPLLWPVAELHAALTLLLVRA